MFNNYSNEYNRLRNIVNNGNTTNSLLQLNSQTGIYRYYLDSGYSFQNRQGNDITIKSFSIISDNSNLTTSINAFKTSNPATTTLRTGGLTTVGGFNRVFFPTPDGVGYTMYICSTSTSDTSDGTGGRKVYINYIDADWDEQTTEVSLNGQTPVALTPTNIIRINRMQLSEVGTDHTNRGAITIQTVNNFSSGIPQTHIVNAIPAGYSYSPVSIYTTPRHTRLWYTKGSFYSGANASQGLVYNEFDTFPWDSSSPNTNRITWNTGCLAFSRSTDFQTQNSASSFPCNDTEFTLLVETSTTNVNVFWSCITIKDPDNF